MQDKKRKQYYFYEESTQEKIEKKVESFIKHWSQKEGNAIKSLKAAAECVLESRDVYNTLLIYLENLQKTTVQNEELIEKVHASVNMVNLHFTIFHFVCNY